MPTNKNLPKQGCKPENPSVILSPKSMRVRTMPNLDSPLGEKSNAHLCVSYKACLITSKSISLFSKISFFIIYSILPLI
jgi:hypothetical protein